MDNNRKRNCILVTGGAGFIGSNFIRYIFKNTGYSGYIINVDSLTYAGNIHNLQDIEEEFGSDRYIFKNYSICDFEKISFLFEKYEIDTVVHFAAESHVDRSILGPSDFINTNILGTFTLLEIVRKYWKLKQDVLFHHVSTDEVYGSLGSEGYFTEKTAYNPSSPYSASKASSDHLVRAYYHTYGVPITISNCSNNYGPYQFPEKLIPLIINNIIENKPLPIYGDGKNIRDWLYVKDHCSAIKLILDRGIPGESYNIGGENELENITIVNMICEIISDKHGKTKDYYKKLIKYVKDRPGHDRRYAINCDLIKNNLGWKREMNFSCRLKETVEWYLENRKWIDSIKTGEYMNWIGRNYSVR